MNPCNRKSRKSDQEDGIKMEGTEKKSGPNSREMTALWEAISAKESGVMVFFPIEDKKNVNESRA
jgi:hypothetical protein